MDSGEMRFGPPDIADVRPFVDKLYPGSIHCCDVARAYKDAL